jgi:8-oxo-dGTP pyrophosphatase MutT (NUDIX family)
MKHTYSAGGIILNGGGQILLINEGGDFWGLSKGRQEAGESLLEAARREIKEEAGLDNLKLLDELGTYERHPHNAGYPDTSELKHITIYAFLTEQTSVPKNIEGNEIGWFGLTEAIDKLSSAQDRRFLASKLPAIQAF